MAPIIRVDCPIDLLVTMVRCWKCGHPETAIALGVHSGIEIDEGEEVPIGDPADASDLILLMYIEDLPSDVLAEVRRANPQFQVRASQTAEGTYYANGCACGSLFGDHYLMSEPGKGFFRLVPRRRSESRIGDCRSRERASFVRRTRRGLVS